jgi:ParB family chromosome partitioning protein
MELKMDQIKVPVGTLKSGFNYRRKFDPVAMDALVDDIKRQNLIQPITVRPFEDGYQVIAGGRRVEAFKRAFGVDEPIPAFVRILSDAEATAAMVAENKIRQDTTAIEDAEAATRMLGLLNGDKEETALRLGWNAQLLARRLALMNAADKVRDAYIDDKIKLGHVEILAALRREVQDKVLTKMLALPTMPTVEQLKAMAEQTLLGLDAAIFDKTECAGCHFNTGLQQTMFETSFAGARCTNGECYNKKTDSELEARKAALVDEYQVVRIVRPGENMTVRPLKADGPKGVGSQQAAACRTCGDFGACVSAAPDKLGMTFKDVCFNSECNSKMVDKHIAAEKAKDRTEAVQSTQASEPVNAGDDEGDSEPVQAKAKPAKPDQSPAKESVTTASIRNAVKEYREDIWRKAFNRGALNLPLEQSRALLVTLCLFRPNDLAATDAKKAIAKATNSEELQGLRVDELAKGILALSKEHLSSALTQIPAYLSSTTEISSIVGLLNAFNVDLARYWKVNEKFFDTLTKTELDAVCVEIGLAAALGEKPYAKAKAGSKADFIKAVLSVDGFEYKGKIPALMRW